MIEIFIWILIIGGPIAGFSLIFFGIKANKKEKFPFRLKDVFLRTSIHEKSGTIMIIEGAAIIFCSIIIMCYYFF